MGLKVNSFAFRNVSGDPSNNAGESIVVKLVLLAMLWGFSEQIREPEIGVVWLIVAFIMLLVSLALLLTVISVITTHIRSKSEDDDQ